MKSILFCVTVLLMTLNSWADEQSVPMPSTSNSSFQRIVSFEIPKQYMDASMRKKIMLMIKYNFKISKQKLNTCNAYAAADLTADFNDGTYSIGPVTSRPSGTERGCSPDDFDDHERQIMIINLSDSNGKSLSESAWSELTDTVSIERGEITYLSQFKNRFRYTPSKLKKFKVPSNISVDAIVYEINEQNPTTLNEISASN